MKKYLILVAVLLLWTGTAYAVTVFKSNQVGTSPVSGYYLTTDGTNSSWAAVSGGGGGGGSGAFLYNVSKDLNYPATTTSSFVIGGSATTTKSLLNVLGIIAGDSLIATSTTATSTFAGGLSVAGTSGLTVLQNGNVKIGQHVNYLDYLGTAQNPLTITDNVNDISGSTFTNLNTGPYSAGCHSFLNSNSLQNTAFSTNKYYASICFSGANFALFSGLPPNSLGVTVTDGSLLFAVASSSTAVQQIAFGLGAGYVTSNYDVLFSANNTSGQPRVAIGTTSPFAKLSIANESLSTNPIFAISTSTASATSTAFIIDSNGKVGIGTTSPSQQLSVQGNGLFSKNVTLGGSLGVGTTSPSALLSVNAPAGSDSFFIGSSTSSYFVVNKLGNVGIGGAAVPRTGLDVMAGGISFGKSGFSSSVSLGSVSTSLSGLITPSSTNGGLSIYGQDSASFNPAINITGVQGSTGALTKPAVAITGLRGTTGSTAGRVIENANKVFEMYNLNTNFPLVTVLGNGAMGIGTTSPWGLLSIAATSSMSNNPPLFTVSTSTTNSTSTAFIINSNGKVGIGTTTPTGVLSTRGSVFHQDLRSSSTGNAVCISAGELLDAGGAACVPSSIQFKENVKKLSLNKATSIVKDLKFVSFDYKEGAYSPEDSPKSYGLIAEDVFKTHPELVDLGYDKKPRSIFFEKFVGIFGTVIQNLLTITENHEDRITKLESQIKLLELKLK